MRPIFGHCVVAVTSCLMTFAWLIIACRARTASAATSRREGFRDNTAPFVVQQPPDPPYRRSDAAVFEAYMRLHGTAPTELAMKHYAYIKRVNGLDDKGVVARIKHDLDESV